MNRQSISIKTDLGNEDQVADFVDLVHALEKMGKCSSYSALIVETDDSVVMQLLAAMSPSRPAPSSPALPPQGEGSAPEAAPSTAGAPALVCSVCKKPAAKLVKGLYTRCYARERMKGKGGKNSKTPPETLTYEVRDAKKQEELSGLFPIGANERVRAARKVG